MYKILLSLFILLTLSSCEGDSTQSTTNEQSSPPPLAIPLGDEVDGLTLGGHLAGKKAYFVAGNINRSECWLDSVTWTGSELYYALTKIDFTRLLAGNGYEPNPNCTLPLDQTDDEFDIYRATIDEGSWSIIRQDMNSVEADAGMSISNNTMAYTTYPLSGIWNIFLTNKIGDDQWDTPTAFEHNSNICREDNPEIYANGTKMIFETTRTVADGSASYADQNEFRDLWFSEKSGANWRTPVKISGTPNIGDKNTQPWVDEVNGYLYWTADKECACVRRIEWVNDSSVGGYEDIITPSISSLSNGSADGKAVFVGEYSEANGYVFFSCAIATQEDPSQSNPDYFMNEWSMDIYLCVIPL